ncbi:MAG: CoA synthetase [Chloroflexota bacterium]|nr:CoA synthetase [Chloroflexota bacterium]
MSDDYKPVLRAGSDPLVFFKYPGEGGGEISRGQVIAAAISHELRDGETVVMGANSLLPLAAARLAQLTHAPNLTIIAGASGGINTLVEPLVPSSGDYSNLIAEAALTFPEVLTLQMGGKTDVFFAGGIQIDRHGACNLAYIERERKVTLRGPGSAGVPWAGRSGRTILYTTTHTTKTFVPEVDFVSLPGWNSGHGPDLIVTPLCVFSFTDAREIRLVSIHAGVTSEQVRANTGFSLPDGDPPETPAPTAQELQIMRAFDLDGLLTVVV